MSTELRRTIATVSSTRVVFFDSAEYGAKLGLSQDPSLSGIRSCGATWYGYVIGDQTEAEKLVGQARKNKVQAQHYGIPSVPGLAEKIYCGEPTDLDAFEKRILGKVVASFIDVATTGMGRATHYNSKEDQQRAEQLAHATMFLVDRKTYALLSALTGLTDNSKKLSTWSLLEWPGMSGPSELDLQQEFRVLHVLAKTLSAPRLFQLFTALEKSKCNNARTRKLILSSLFNESNLQWWAVKYRRKMQKALTHAWGIKRTGIIKNICTRAVWNTKEQGILADNVWRYARNSHQQKIAETIAFVFGLKRTSGWSEPLFRAYYDARVDLKDGKNLPPEVLEGIRSTYHPEVPKEKALRLTASSGSHTNKQAMQKQRAAKAAGADLKFDPNRHDAISLYVYAYEMGMTDDVKSALNKKAKATAATLPMSLDGAVVIADCSKSMEGSGDQKMRPIATAWALSDVLRSAGATGVRVSGHRSGGLWRPSGDTSLVASLVDALKMSPSAVYVISDGYENAPAGRFQEVVEAARGLGVTTPIYHINPVAAAEVGAVRELAPRLVPTLPITNPRAFAPGLLRQSLETDPIAGIKTLLDMAARDLAAQSEKLALGSAKKENNKYSTKKPLKLDLSPTMTSALARIYASLDREFAVEFRSTESIRAPTLRALERRGLLVCGGDGMIKPTKLGKAAFARVQKEQ